jgi:antitoxin ParD1/3/4
MLIRERGSELDTSLSLPTDLVDLIEMKIESGRFASAGDVIREGLRLLEDADRREREGLRQLQDAWREGVASGDAGPLDFANLRDDARRELAARG